MGRRTQYAGMSGRYGNEYRETLSGSRSRGDRWRMGEKSRGPGRAITSAMGFWRGAVCGGGGRGLAGGWGATWLDSQSEGLANRDGRSESRNGGTRESGSGGRGADATVWRLGTSGGMDWRRRHPRPGDGRDLGGRPMDLDEGGGTRARWHRRTAGMRAPTDTARMPESRRGQLARMIDGKRNMSDTEPGGR